jgi:hypothetical protein
MATDDGRPEAARLVVVRVLDHRVDQRVAGAGMRRAYRFWAFGRRLVRIIRGEAVRPLLDVPAEVSALDGDADLLPELLAGVADEKVAGAAQVE